MRISDWSSDVCSSDLWVRNGATLQTGLGKIPGAVLRGLTDHRNLHIHSGLIGDAVLDLLEAGALAADNPITAGVAIGSQRLYNAVSGAPFQFPTASHPHDRPVLSSLAHPNGRTP